VVRRILNDKTGKYGKRLSKTFIKEKKHRYTEVIMYNKELSVNAIRILSAEAVQKANSGHPGLPMGAAPLAYSIWAENMLHNPLNPKFDNRDRFVLSAGHGSMLLYSLLHLFGYGVTMDDLKNFRQFGSKTPGHPEYLHTPGVETTTGPLGQGFANAVGMAIAETHLAAKFNREGFPLVDHYTFAICGDGCMMEGIEAEAASLAGTLKLGKLIVLYDDNDISIEGNTDIAFTEDVCKRHRAQGWHIVRVSDGNDVDAITRAIRRAKKITDRPSLIVVKTVIGYGSPLAGKHDSHGAPLGAENLELTKKALGWTYAPFEVPEEVKAHMAKVAGKGRRAENRWKKMFRAYKRAYPELAEEYTESMSVLRLIELARYENLFEFDKPDATRNTSFTVLNKLADIVPNLIGGSADLAPSNKSNMKNRGDYSAENRLGSNLHFGVREHAMSAISNGIQLHGGLRAYCATFFVFSDYMKNAMRMSALMGLNVTYILTHDSIGVGEDGPTHQPVEHLISLRSIPGMKVFRPADGKETAAAWLSALTGKGPTCLVLTRQNLPQYENTGLTALKGGYVLEESAKKTPDVILMASGSEVELAVKSRAALLEKGIDARVVTMPCMELFDAQPDYYRERILPSAVRARVAIEAGTAYSWYKYGGLDAAYVTMDTFGASAPAGQLFKHFGFTVDNVVEKAIAVVEKLK
jgi:transketolase